MNTILFMNTNQRHFKIKDKKKTTKNFPPFPCEIVGLEKFTSKDLITISQLWSLMLQAGMQSFETRFLSLAGE